MTDYKHQTIDEITNIINSYPEDTYFQVPSDIFAHSNSFVKAPAAIVRLSNYNEHWLGRDVQTTFFIWGENHSTLIWVKELMKYEAKHLVKISMSNKEISDFAVNMMTPLD